MGLRVLNANYRLGESAHATAVAQLAANVGMPEPLRLEALAMLSQWSNPSTRERIVGTWQPLPARSSHIGSKAAGEIVQTLIHDASTSVRRAVLALAQRYQINEATDSLLAFASDQAKQPIERAEAIRCLSFLKGPVVKDLIQSSLVDSSSEVRSAARFLFSIHEPEKAIDAYKIVLIEGEISQQRDAIRRLGKMKEDHAFELVLQELKHLVAGKSPLALELDIISASQDTASHPSLTGKTLRQRKSEIKQTSRAIRKTACG